jgi:DNA-binding NarL/FixJ family response regulator
LFRAEQSRFRLLPDPPAWRSAAEQWEELGHRHRAAYARWRQAEALLLGGNRLEATVALTSAWAHADQHEPLRTQIGSLARMARVQLARPEEPPALPPEVAPPFNLTDRELDVLRLLVDGRTNAEIGKLLYMSPKTASVHVSAILRKLQASNRVHAAAIAQRHGLNGD